MEAFRKAMKNITESKADIRTRIPSDAMYVSYLSTYHDLR
jgi:hypothetical protein